MPKARLSVGEPKTWLPREGFHADVLGSILRQTLLNPTLLLPLVLAAKYTIKGREVATHYPRLSSWAKVLATLGIFRIFNAWLNRKVVNNWVSDKYDWDGGKELVVVTGGSDGIGKEVALNFAKRGIKVAVIDVQPLTYSAPDNLRFYECDITSQAAVERTATAIQTQLGEPTVLINNAGICRGKPILESSARDVSLTFEINTIAHYTLARELLPAMIGRNHGMVVTVASSAAWVTAPRMTEYAASKAAALAFHEGLSAELVSHYKANRVRTVVVNQGYTRTKLFEGFGVARKSFFGPALEVETVSEAIVEQVLKGESGQIIVPGIYKLAAANFRSLPTWMQHRGRAQLDNLMANWKGRQVAALG